MSLVDGYVEKKGKCYSVRLHEYYNELNDLENIAE